MLSNVLTPRQAAALLAVSESTVRRWCDGDLLASSRTTGGHRRIDRATLLEFARERGLRVVSEGPAAIAGRGGRLSSNKELSARLLQIVLNGDEEGVREFVTGALDQSGDAASLCDEVIAPVMHALGEQWANGTLPVFREHAATQTIQSALSAARARLRPPAAAAPIAICAALSGDPYALGPSMASLVLRAEGFGVTLLGPDSPAAEILRAALAQSASLIAVSIGATAGVELAAQKLVALCEGAADHGVRVALGGRQLSAELRARVQPDFFGDTMTHLATYARRLGDRR